MRVLVTGGAGRIGRIVVAHLRDSGWDVTSIDIADDPQIAGIEYSACDITRFDEVMGNVRGCDAVVHLAALPSPYSGYGHELYRINTVGTFNVFEAAAQSGVQRVVQASSINAVGAFWSVVDIRPQYFPIDEDHPPFTTDPYSFAKQQAEAIGAYFWRRDGLRSVALRLPGIYQPDYTQSTNYWHRRTAAWRTLDSLRAMPVTECRSRIDAAVQRSIEFRRGRRMEYPEQPTAPTDSDSLDDSVLRAVHYDRFNFWASMDVRDAALAVECALRADLDGSHALFVNDSHNYWGYDSHALVEMFFPDVTTWKRAVPGSEALVSIDRARALIGFEPQYSLAGSKTP